MDPGTIGALVSGVTQSLANQMNFVGRVFGMDQKFYQDQAVRDSSGRFLNFFPSERKTDYTVLYIVGALAVLGIGMFVAIALSRRKKAQ